MERKGSYTFGVLLILIFVVCLYLLSGTAVDDRVVIDETVFLLRPDPSWFDDDQWGEAVGWTDREHIVLRTGDAKITVFAVCNHETAHFDENGELREHDAFSVWERQGLSVDPRCVKLLPYL